MRVLHEGKHPAVPWSDNPLRTFLPEHEESDVLSGKQWHSLQTETGIHFSSVLSSQSIQPDYPDNRHYYFLSANYKIHPLPADMAFPVL